MLWVILGRAPSSDELETFRRTTDGLSQEFVVRLPLIWGIIGDIMAKGSKHYFKDGTEHKGSVHKMPNGALHSNKTHTKTSKPVFHFKKFTGKSRGK